jgi:SAM-dependent methyltransferase
MYQVEDEINASSPLMRLVMNYGIYKRCRIVMREKTEGILLDVGCATGIFLEAMQKTNRWITKGVEISEQAARIARDYKHLDVITGNLEKADLPNDYFDVVTLWDVLEHLHDPVGSLREIYRILKPNGIIVFRVPNAGSLDARLFSAFWAGFDAPRHLYVFERSTLGIMLGKTGFNVIQMKCDLGSYPASVMSLRFWLSGNSVKPKKRKRINRFVNSLFARVVFAPFFFLINRLNLGSSLTVVAGKR